MKSIITVPQAEGWYWIRAANRWAIIRVRQLAEEWHGLNPYTGQEIPLNDDHWDYVTALIGPISEPFMPVETGELSRKWQTVQEGSFFVPMTSDASFCIGFNSTLQCTEVVCLLNRMQRLLDERQEVRLTDKHKHSWRK